MANRADAKSVVEAVSTLCLVLLLYFLSFGAGRFNSVTYGVTSSHSEGSNSGNFLSHLETCSPLPSRSISPSAASGDLTYLHMLPRPKVIVFPGQGLGGNYSLSDSHEGILSFSSYLTIEVVIDRPQPDAQLIAGVAVEARRLCTQSRSLIGHAEGMEIDGVVNGSRVLYIHKVEAFIVSDDTYFSDWVTDAVPTGAGEGDVYTIDVARGVLTIHSPSIEGLRNAMASASQIMENPSALRLPLRVVDWPSQRWRGLMVDVARHFMPVRKLYRLVDAMHAMKLNRLHLHLTDAQSFPVLLKDMPGGLALSELARHGSFNPNEIYTLAELGDLVKYSNSLGIDIIPEVDVPAHTLAWAGAFPDIVVTCPKAMARGNGASTTDVPALDITNPKTLAVIKGVLQQLSEVFTSEYMHVGGDEVHEDCWEESENMMMFKTANNSDWITMLRIFEGQVFNIVYDLEKVPIIWQGIQDVRAVPIPGSEVRSGRVIVQPWKCWSGLSSSASLTASKAGREVVMSACMYLDWDVEWGGLLAVTSLSSAVTVAIPLVVPNSDSGRRRLRSDHQDTLSLMYTLINISNKMTPDLNSSNPLKDRPKKRRSLQEAHANGAIRSAVLGGEAAQWSEGTDFTNLECRVWPRAAASAAVFWGFPDASNYSDAIAAGTMEVKPRFPSTQSWTGSREAYYSTMLGQIRLLESYTFARQFLSDVIRISPSLIIVHIDDSKSCVANYPTRPSKQVSPTSSLRPVRYTDSALLFSHLNEELQCSQANNIEYFFPSVTSQCQLIPRHFHMPVVGTEAPNRGDQQFSHRLRGSKYSSLEDESLVDLTLKVTSYNIENGGYDGNRGDAIHDWMLSRAAAGDIIVGLVELNKWQNLKDSVNRKQNLEEIVFKASSSGFTYSHVTSSSQHPYSVGLVSVLPFEVIAEYGPPTLLRLMLHVYFESLDLHVLVLHLTPHSSIARRAEVLFVRSIVKPLLDANSKLMLMGDLNTLAPSERCALYDSSCGGNGSGNQSYNFVNTIEKSQHPVYKRLRDKYCTYSSNGSLAVDYVPFQQLLDAGLMDACDVACRDGNVSIDRYANPTYISCLLHNCGHSEPTMLDPEWPLSELGTPAPKLKVDYILISPAILNSLRSSKEMNSMVMKNEATDALSDHYPVHVEFPFKCSSRFWRRIRRRRPL